MMRAWTIILALFFGYLVAGPIGATVGLLFGHFFSSSYYKFANFQYKIQLFYFKALFLVMGKLCKADGVVTEAEIKATRAVFNEMELTPEAKKQAIRYFYQGRADDFDFTATLNELYNICSENKGLLRLFIETLFKVAQVDGFTANKRELLDTVCQILGFNPKYYYQEQTYQKSYTAQPKQTLDNDYALLEVPHNVSAHDLKKAYRRLMNQHHPDKLIAKGLPESMIKIATDKTQAIQAAYDRIKKAKGY